MSKHRVEKLTDRLRSRIDHTGKPLRGYEQNVAALKAEIAILQENIDKENFKNG